MRPAPNTALTLVLSVATGSMLLVTAILIDHFGSGLAERVGEMSAHLVN
jgi:hypothetical protein